MKKGLKIIEKVAAYAAVFFLPSQLAFHFWPTYSFIFGIRVDYLSPAIYFTDVIVIGLFVVYLINDGKTLIRFIVRNKPLLFIITTLAVTNIIFSSVFFLSLYKWIKLAEIAFFGIYIYLRQGFVQEKQFIKIFLSSSVLVALIGIFQFFLGKTTGLFYFLGERTFSLHTPGIALASINGEIYLRAYSIFSHPNSLAGYLGVSLLLLLFSKVLKRRFIWYISILILLFGFVLTFSLSAYIAFAILFTVYIFHRTKIFSPKLLLNFLWISVLASIVLPVYSDQILKRFKLPENITQRIDLSYVSGKMIGEHLWIGEGANTFIVNSVRFKGANTYMWLLQPVHNIFLLEFTEIGLVGLVLFVTLFYVAINRSVKHKNFLMIFVLFFILFTGLSDHYWLTMQQNLLLISFIIGYKLRLKS